MATEKTSRCWPGYEPVPGKEQHEQGSCRKKAPSKSTPPEKKVQTARKQQLDRWQDSHEGAPTSAAQHLPAPAAAKTASKRPSPKTRKKS